MVRKFLVSLLVPVFLVSLASNVYAQMAASVLDKKALIAVEIRSTQDLEKFYAVGLPVYTRLSTDRGQQIILGAAPQDLARITDRGLVYRVLDQEISESAYFVVHNFPGEKGRVIGRYGQVLLDIPDGVLLKATPTAIDLLVAAGGHVRALSLEEKSPFPSADQYQAPTLVEVDPFVTAMVHAVSPTTVYTYSGNLTGRWPVSIDGAPYTITSRTTFSGEPLEKATRLVGNHMEALGLEVEYHSWDASYPPNVIGQRTGSSRPDEIFIVGAHLDNLPYGPLAPGMDDNASGSIGVLLAADILSEYHWDCTLRFVFWTGEEQGLWGSSAYAQRAAQQGEDIRAVLNLDMIAWNTAGTEPTIELHANSSITPTLEVAQLFVDVVDTYSLNLDPEIIPNGTDRSDHASFWDWGYTAILGIEDFGGDFNPNYHSTGDTYENLQDIPYFVEFIKSAVAMYAHLAGCRATEDDGTLEGTVVDFNSGMPLDNAVIEIETAQGYQFSTSVASSGVYSTPLPTDVYTVTASALGYLPESIFPVNIFTGTITSQFFMLEPADTVYFPVFNVNDP